VDPKLKYVASNTTDTDRSLEFDENPTHAMDMFSVIYGTVKDINVLIDLLPGYLYPGNEDGILEWGVLGVSQGAHAAWMALAQVGAAPHPSQNLIYREESPLGMQRCRLSRFLQLDGNQVGRVRFEAHVPLPSGTLYAHRSSHGPRQCPSSSFGR